MTPGVIGILVGCIYKSVELSCLLIENNTEHDEASSGDSGGEGDEDEQSDREGID